MALLLPEPSGNPLGSALRIFLGLRQYFIVHPSSRHNTVTIGPSGYINRVKTLLRMGLQLKYWQNWADKKKQELCGEHTVICLVTITLTPMTGTVWYIDCAPSVCKLAQVLPVCSVYYRWSHIVFRKSMFYLPTPGFVWKPVCQQCTCTVSRFLELPTCQSPNFGHMCWLKFGLN